MNKKWKIFYYFIGLYVVGIIGVAWHTYGEKQDTVEVIKIVFITLGGLGVILPTYLNSWQSFETANLISDQMKRNVIENTFQIIEKWDDQSLLQARKFTRELKEQHNTLSPDKIKEKINDPDSDLKQSIILLFNYFDSIRISIEQERVDKVIIKSSLGTTFLDIYSRFNIPWIQEQSPEYQADVEKLVVLLR